MEKGSQVVADGHGDAAVHAGHVALHCLRLVRRRERGEITEDRPWRRSRGASSGERS
jgi:hypothetical protein